MGSFSSCFCARYEQVPDDVIWKWKDDDGTFKKYEDKKLIRDLEIARDNDIAKVYWNRTWSIKYVINVKTMTQTNLSTNYEREVRRIDVPLITPFNGEAPMTVKKYASENQKAKDLEENLLQNYNRVPDDSSANEMEKATVNALKALFGDGIRIVNKRNPKAPEFNFLDPPLPRPWASLRLKDFSDVTDGPSKFKDIPNLSGKTREKIERALREKIAKGYDCDPGEIKIIQYRKGSIIVDYLLPNDLDTHTLNQIQGASQKLKDEFQAFCDLKIHAALYRPEFDVGMFDEKGHKNFKHEGSTYEVGGRTYTQPNGWIRMGLKVLNKYGRDSTWLHPFQHQNNWVRGYHGMGSANGDGVGVTSMILKSGGLRPSKRGTAGNTAVYGNGIYWSDVPDFGYDGHTECNGNHYDVKLQIAIKPSAVIENTDHNFRTENKKNVRIYGILLKKRT